MSRAGDSIRKGLEQAIQYAKGEASDGYRVHLPEAAKQADLARPKTQRPPSSLPGSLRPRRARTNLRSR